MGRLLDLLSFVNLMGLYLRRGRSISYAINEARRAFGRGFKR